MAAPTAAEATCPAYPWPHDGAQRGGKKKVFMQSDCAACHSMLPYAIVREAAQEVGLPKAAEIVVAAAEEAPLAARPVHGGGGTFTPDLTTLVANVRNTSLSLAFLACNMFCYALFSFRSRKGLATTCTPAAATPRMLADGAAVCQELKKMVWLQFVQTYMRTFQAA